MGCYFMAVCEARQELIDPHELDQGAKASEVVFGDFSQVVMTYAIDGEWAGESIRIVADERTGDVALYEHASSDFKDVTADAAAVFKDRWQK